MGCGATSESVEGGFIPGTPHISAELTPCDDECIRCQGVIADPQRPAMERIACLEGEAKRAETLSKDEYYWEESYGSETEVESQSEPLYVMDRADFKNSILPKRKARVAQGLPT